mgnify:FL=1
MTSFSWSENDENEIQYRIILSKEFFSSNFECVFR